MEKFAEIRPERVRLAGSAGTSLFAEVEITPRKDYPSTIQRFDVRDGSFSNYELTRRCSDGQGGCVIRMEIARTEKGRYVDTLIVRTDSPLRPDLQIFITGTVH